MMIVFQALSIAVALSGGVLFGMKTSLIDKPISEWIEVYQSEGKSIGDAIDGYQKEHLPFHELFQLKEHKELKVIIERRHSMFESMAPEIRKLAQNNKNWKKILDNKDHTETLLYTINANLSNHGRDKTGFDLNVRNYGRYIYLELAAALLGTPGAIKFGKGFIQQDEARERLKDFLFMIVESGDSRPGCCEMMLSWPDEDVDVVRAGLDMGLDPYMRSNARGWSSGGEPLLTIAVEAKKDKVVALLLKECWEKRRFAYCALGDRESVLKVLPIETINSIRLLISELFM